MKKRQIIKKRIFAYLINVIFVLVVIFKILHVRFMPVIYKYGKYQCENITENLINVVLDELIIEELKGEIIKYDSGESNHFDFNVSILNSVNKVLNKLVE